MNRTIKIILIILVIIFMIPTISNAAWVYCTCGTDHHAKSLLGIYCEILNKKEQWIDADVNQHELSETWWGTATKEAIKITPHKDVQIMEPNSLCYGHSDAPTWHDPTTGIDRTDIWSYKMIVVDIGKDVTIYHYKEGTPRTITDKNDKIPFYKLAYYILKSSEGYETGNCYTGDGYHKAIYKEYIRGWLIDNYKKVGIDVQGVGNGDIGAYIGESCRHTCTWWKRSGKWFWRC